MLQRHIVSSAPLVRPYTPTIRPAIVATWWRCSGRFLAMATGPTPVSRSTPKVS